MKSETKNNFTHIFVINENKASKVQLILFLTLGLLFLIQGYIGIAAEEQKLIVLHWLQLILGIVYLIAPLAYLKVYNRETYIKIDGKKILVKKNLFTKEKVFEANLIKNISFDSSRFLIESSTEKFVLRLANLSYNQRNKAFPEFLKSVEEFKKHNGID